MTVGVELVRPAFHTAPAYDFTLGPVVGDFCRGVGYIPDPEQQLGLDDIFAEDEHQRPVMSSYAVIGPRRNIKTGLEIQTAMGWLYVLEVKDVHYSAHKWKTALATFETFSEIIRNSDDLSRQMLPSSHGTGYAQLRWRNNAVMTFETRTLDGGRGEGTDKHILDEALKLRPPHVGSLLPALATRPLAQVLYGSSAGQATSDILRDIRDRGRPGGDPSLGYLEFGAPGPDEEIAPGELVCDLGLECTHRRGTPGCGMDKPHVIAVANSQCGRRIPAAFFVEMRASLPPAEFGREFLSWWDEPLGKTDETTPFDVARWDDLVDADPTHAPEEITHYGVEVDPDGAFASIGAAGVREDGRTHLELIERHRGTRWVVGRAQQIEDEYGAGTWAIDGGGPAARLIDDFEDAGLHVLTLGTADVGAACADLVDAVNEPDEELVAHGPQPELDAGIEGARKRPIGGDGRYSLGRLRSDVDVTPVLAVAWAKFALEHGNEVSVFFFDDLEDDDDLDDDEDGLV